jgi:hypothetical protein
VAGGHGANRITLTDAGLDMAAGVSTQQTISLGSGVTGGYFDLGVTLPGASSAATAYTPPIAWNASADAVKSALMGIEGISQGDVEVSTQAFDLAVKLSDGSVVGVDLRGAETVGDVLLAFKRASVVNAAGQTVTPLSASLSASGALVLSVADNGSGGGPITLSAVGGAKAAQSLGLLGTGVSSLSMGNPVGGKASLTGSALTLAPGSAALTSDTALSSLNGGFQAGNGSWTVRFTGRLAGLAVPTVTVLNHLTASGNGTVSVGTSYEHTVRLAPGVDGGSFSLSVKTPSGALATTRSIAYNASATDVAQAVAALTGLTLADVAVDGGAGNWRMKLIGQYLNAPSEPTISVAAGHTLTVAGESITGASLRVDLTAARPLAVDAATGATARTTVSGISEARLSGSAGRNVLDVSGFAGTADLQGAGSSNTFKVGERGTAEVRGVGAADVLVASSAAESSVMTLRNGELTITPHTGNTVTDTLHGISQVQLQGGDKAVLDAAGFTGFTDLKLDTPVLALEKGLGVAGQHDVQVNLADGSALQVSLKGLSTVKDVIKAFAYATGVDATGKALNHVLSLAIDASGKGLVLTVVDPTHGSHEVSLAAVGTSRAAAYLWA